jgi:FG-GAP-like repeat
MNIRLVMQIFTPATLLYGCGGGGDSNSGSAPTPPLVTAETSYKNFKSVGLTPQTLPTGRTGVGTVRAYGDFSRSGQLDLFTATLTYWPPTTPAAATPSIFEFWRKQANGTFLKDTQMLASPDGCIHPRKAIVADFNGDGRPDVFVACHGFDAAPFPGERNKIILSQANGTYVTQDASSDIGFFHSASAADLNGDGLPDVVVTNNFDPASAFVLLNQGGDAFQREASARLPSSIGGKPYFSVELVDPTTVNGQSVIASEDASVNVSVPQ